MTGYDEKTFVPFTTAECLEEGDVINVGDPTEEPISATVIAVEVEDLTVTIHTKEIAFPIKAQVGEQVSYSDE